MSNHIDERIVKMTFDNSAFEGRIEKTIQSLEKLNSVLKNTGNTEAVNQLSKSMKDIKSNLSTLNLDELDKLTAKQSVWQKIGGALSNVGKGIGTIFSKLDIGGTISKLSSSFGKATDGSDGLGKSVEMVSSKFSALGIMGATALANITNKAMNAGAAMLKSLTIDPIKVGLAEYETKMNSIQTIMANTSHKGTSYDDVVKALDELNTYSDKTIYNFAQMTDNIGKFTSAGVDLDKSVASIKGLANVAAMSGVDNARAAGVMYQASQAMAKGYFQLQDWRSFSNNGMGNERFRDALIQTSEIMGTGAKAAIKAAGSFDESLSKSKWLTSDVMAETLKILAGGYTEADLIAKGYSKAQAANLMSLAKDAENAATQIRTVTQLFDTMGESIQSGWAKSWEWIIGDKEQATELLTNISKGFESIVGPMADARNKVLEEWNKGGGRDSAIKGFTNIFGSIGKVAGSIKDAFRDIFPAMTGKRLIEITKGFEKLTEKLKVSDKTAGKIKNVFKGVFSVFDMVKDSVVSLLSGFTPLGKVFGGIGSIALSVASGIGKFATSLSEAVKNSNVFEKIAGGMRTAFNWIGDAINGVKGGFDEFSSYIGNLDFSKAFGFIGKGFGAVGKMISPIFTGLGKAIGSIDFGTIMKALQTATFASVLKTLKGVFDEIGGVAESAKGIFGSFKGVGKNISETLSSVGDTLKAWQDNLKADSLMKIAGAVAMLAASLVVLSTLNFKDMMVGLTGMTVIMAELVAATIAMGSSGKIGLKASTSMLSMATAILILSGALKILSTISIGETITGLVGMAGLLVTLGAAVKILETGSKNLKKTAASLVIFGIAMMTMAGALKMIGSIDAETMGAGLFSLAIVLGEIAAFLAVAKYGSLSVSTATGVLIISAALVVLSQAVKQLGNLNEGQITKGLASIAAVLAGIAVFSKLAGSGLSLISLSVGLTGVSAAMLIMSAAISALGKMSWETIARGLTSMAGSLTILGVATQLISGVKMTVLSVGIAAMSASLLLLSAALQSLGGMTWQELGVGLVALAGSLTILAVAMAAMSGGLMGAAAMVVMAGALALLTPQLLLLSQLSLAQVGIGLLALAGAFTVLGVAGLLLTPLIVPLMGLGAAVALLGVGCLAAGAGVSMFATGIALLAGAVGGGGLVVVEFIRQLINLLPQLGVKMGEAIIGMAGAIGQGGSALISAFQTLLSSMLTAIGTLIPQIVDTAVEIVIAFAQGLATGIPALVTAGMEMISGVLEGIAANIGGIVTAAADIVINFMDGISAKLPSIIASGINLALSFIEGVANGVSSNTARIEAAVRTAINAMIKAGLAVIKGAISGFTSGGKALLQGLCNGIKSMLSAAGSAVKSCVSAAVKAASNLGSKLVSAGKSLIQGLITGIKNMASSVAKAAGDVVQGAINKAKSVLKINSPSKVFIGIGSSVNEGFVKGLDKYANTSAKAGGRLAETVIDSVKNPLSKMGSIIDGKIDVNPVIAPVMDLTNVQNGSRMISNMLSNVSGVGVTANGAGAISRTIGNIQNGNDNSDIVSALKDLQDTVSGTAGNTYQINGITYDDGSNISDAVQTLVRAAKIERRM